MKKNLSVLKRVIQSQKRAVLNTIRKSQAKTAIKKFNTELNNKNFEVTSDLMRIAYSRLDKGLKKGVYRQNYVIRKKSQMARKLNQMKKEEQGEKSNS